jgi:hypothetical protein
MISSTLFYCTLAAIAVSAAIALLAPHLAQWWGSFPSYKRLCSAFTCARSARLL